MTTVALGTPVIETLADLHERLGRVPLSRIRCYPAPGTATEADVLAYPRGEKRLYELVDGVLVEKPLGYYESLLAALLIRFLGSFLDVHDLGIVLGADATLRLAPGLVRLPDVSCIAWERCPNRELPAEPIPALVPDLAVEIVSAGNTTAEMEHKLQEYCSAGVRLVWYVYPEQHTVHVYTSPDDVRVLHEAEMLGGGAVFPGCQLRIWGNLLIIQDDYNDTGGQRMALQAINPATGKTVQTYDEMTPAAVSDVITQTYATFQDWKHTTFAERARVMQRAAHILRENASEYAVLMAQEMGKPIRDGRAEAEKCAWVCEYYAEQAETFLQPEIIPTDASKSFVTFQPLGVVLAVMPWNFPFWQVFRFAAPALMAGNTGVLKHASNVPGCALAIEDVFRQAGFPVHAFSTLLIGSRQVNAVIEHPLVRAVTLTGSTPAGKAVASKAGEMLKKTVLELGGSDAYVVLDDADVEATATTCVASRLINAGQSCIAAKRFVVVESVRAQFEEAFVAQMRLARVGDPLEEQTQVGPMARHDLRDELHQQVQASLDKGATCLLGGAVPEGPGAYYPPTVLTNVTKGMPAYDEELFGPVAGIMAVPDEQEAIRVANDSVFGLGAAVFTQDVAKGERIAAQELEAGCCFVNAFVKSDPRLPFGGIKESGYGRELAAYGIKEFVNIKTVFVK